MAAPLLTDRATLLRNRDRALTAPVTFLHDLVADELEEKLQDLNKSFTKIAHVGFALGRLNGRFGPLIADNDVLGLPPATHDLVVHTFGLHWANDPVGQMVQSRLALEPDGALFGVMFGGRTLSELRACLAQAETEATGGLSPRVLPMADVRDIGNLMQRAGLALPVADALPLTVRYPSLAALLRDVRGMGEGNAMTARLRQPASRAIYKQTETIYRENFSDDDGYLTASFELVFLTGWAPADTQQKPLRPGSAKTRLADVLGVDEHGSDDAATP